MKLNRYNDYVNESSSYLKVYRGAPYPYNYTVIKGDELYFVSYRKGKPFLHKYQGKVNVDVYNPNGALVKNPSKPLIYLIQSKLNGKSNESLNEEFDGNVKDLPSPDRLDFMNGLKVQVEKFLEDYPKAFKVNYVPGKILTIGTGEYDDLKIVIKFSGDKINFNANPTEGPEYEFAYSFDKNGAEEIYKLIESAFKNDPHQGMVSQPSKDKYPSNTDEPPKDIKEEEVEPLDVPITKKPVRRIRSININVIQDVLEDAYILDDIDLKDVSPEELIRRMLLETRSRSKK